MSVRLSVMAGLLPLIALSACGDGGRPVWKGESAKPGAEAAYLQPPRVEAIAAVQAGLALAGTATPGDAISLLSGGKSVGTTKADSSGSWTLGFKPPRSSSPQELLVSAQSVDGTTVIETPNSRRSLERGMTIVQRPAWLVEP